MSKATPTQITEAIDRYFEFHPGSDYVSQIDKDNYRRRETGWSESDFDTYPESERADLLSKVLDAVFAAEDAARRAGVEAHFADEDNVPDFGDLTRELITTVANEVEGLSDITADAYGEFHSNLPVWSTDDAETVMEILIDLYFEGDIAETLENIDGPEGEDSSYWGESANEFDETVGGGFDLDATIAHIGGILAQAALDAIEINDGEPLTYAEITEIKTSVNDGIGFSDWVEIL